MKRRAIVIGGVAGVVGTVLLCFIFRDFHFLAEAMEKASKKWHAGKPT